MATAGYTSTAAGASVQRAVDAALFACRIVYVDNYLGAPLNKDGTIDVIPQSAKPMFVRHPVIRIFGSTPAGQKCCVHVHGVCAFLVVNIYAGCMSACAF
jgi:hypothetical protein